MPYNPYNDILTEEEKGSFYTQNKDLKMENHQNTLTKWRLKIVTFLITTPVIKLSPWV